MTRVAAGSAGIQVPFSTTDELRDVVVAFETCRLPRSEWTHATHVAVAVWYVVWHGHAATDRMREGIQRYNAAHEVVQSPTGGYHETLTCFYVWAVRRHLRSIPVHGTLAEMANTTIAALADRALPLTYFSRERLMSVEARTSFVDPDVRPLE
jgi:hypothetical protein